MLSEKEKQKLINAGYLPSYADYLFKVKYFVENGKRKQTVIFINSNKIISFDGFNKYKKELLREAISLVGGLKWQN